MATISALVPTIASDIDRLSKLRRSLLSALYQLREGDEVICIGDTHAGPLDDARELCLRMAKEAPEGTTLRYVDHNSGCMSWGHDPLNYGMSVAKGEWLTFSDDDDIWATGAFEAIRTYAGQLVAPAPMLFRFKSYHGPCFWIAPGLLGQGLIGGHCIVTPNLPSLLGEWAPHYEGDWSFIEGTLRKWSAVGVAPVFVNRLIAIARPA